MLQLISVLFLLLIIASQLHGQQTIESLLSSLPTVSSSVQAENMTDMIIDLDHVLASVNKTEPVDSTIVPPPKTGFGDRPYMHAINNNYKKEDLLNRTLRLVIPKIEPPYVNYVNFSNSEVVRRGYGPGVVIEILKELSRRLNLTYEMIPYREGQWGSLENGNWSGAFGMMYRKEADILGGGAIMKSPEKFSDNTWLIVTAPFTWEVSISLEELVDERPTGRKDVDKQCMATHSNLDCASGVILYIFVRILIYANEHQFSMIQSVWIFYSVTLQQRGPVQPRSWTCRVLLSLWWMGSLTLWGTFTGALIALFAINKTTMPFYNVNQLLKLIQNGHWQIVMDGTTMTRTNMIKDSGGQTYKDLWYEMSVNRKVVYVQGTAIGVEYILTNANYVLFGPEDTIKYWVAADCRLKKINEGILPTYLSIPFAKNSEYSTYASNLIRELAERGFVEKWIRDYISFMAITNGNNKQCNTTNTASSKYLDLNKSQGAFWVLISGFVFAVTLFVMEILYNGIRTLFEFYKETILTRPVKRCEEKSMELRFSQKINRVMSNEPEVMSSLPRLFLILILSPVLSSFDESYVKREISVDLPHQIISYYNLLRDLHDSPPVIIDQELSGSALSWARHLSMTSNEDKCLYHSRLGGENIYFAWSTWGYNELEFARAAIRAFYEEIKFYNYSQPGLNLPAAHFTNMIWRNCEKIGIGVFHMNYTSSHGACKVKGTIDRPAMGYMLVVHQWPPSNIISPIEFERNVRPPKRSYSFEMR
ncbi:hypothetical protein PRIPAC_96905 [Pristionchus pacificus]|uniref:Uncharacterized protein n=1 Tax=Pristionchus pacificus TaxID=54126 RepID=A0A2A6BY30_PRIPA|nr:hypothetical protein PRIPAC_96905 [Pristionchus pacificus]|eukprot:PDM70671.1 hypothetical protein PRIPAC_43876 [Pristionchus pacificus]